MFFKFKLQVWWSDSAHIDLNAAPIHKKEKILTKKLFLEKSVLVPTNSGDFEVLVEAQDMDSFSLNVTFNGRQLDNGDTPLHWACANDHFSEIKQLIENGENIDAKNNDGRTPLLEAIRCGHNDDVVELLIDNEADVNIHDNFSETPLHWACKYDRVDVAKMLLKKGAKVNAKNNQGITPLHCAGMWRRAELFKLLIEKGSKKKLLKMSRQHQYPYDDNILAEKVESLVIVEDHKKIERLESSQSSINITQSEVWRESSRLVQDEESSRSSSSSVFHTMLEEDKRNISEERNRTLSDLAKKVLAVASRRGHDPSLVELAKRIESGKIATSTPYHSTRVENRRIPLPSQKGAF
jgi:ankyrin repeat protein